MVRFAAAFPVAVALVAACGGDAEMRSGFDGLVACDATTVRVSFDPARDVRVTAGGATLARAAFGRQEVSSDCEVKRKGPAWTASEPSPYRDGGLPERGLYAPAELECRIPGGVAIDAHPILNGDTGVNDGSNLLLLDGESIVLSAILKNEGDPKASRIYHAPRHCAAA